MDYDSYKLETPEDEDERINGASSRRMARQEYLADHADELLELRHEQERENGSVECKREVSGFGRSRCGRP